MIHEFLYFSSKFILEYKLYIAEALNKMARFCSGGKK